MTQGLANHCAVQYDCDSDSQAVYMNDLVNHPDHYVAGRDLEPIDVLMSFFATSPLLWQVGKYLSRCGRKGDPTIDLKKALWYLDRYYDQPRFMWDLASSRVVEEIVDDWFPSGNNYLRSALYSLLMSVTVEDDLTHLDYLHLVRKHIDKHLELLVVEKSDYTFDTFYAEALETVIYDEKYRIMYPALGLAGETGEVAEKIKKLFRDKSGIPDDAFVMSVKKELGDVLWYIAALCKDLDISMSDVAQACIVKLKSRKERNVLQGNGDER